MKYYILLFIFCFFLFSCDLFNLAVRIDNAKGEDQINNEENLYFVTGNPPEFSWPDEDNYYWILACTTIDFDNGGGTIIVDEGNLQDSNFQSLNILSPGIYYWKVKFLNNLSTTVGPWHGPFPFTVE